MSEDYEVPESGPEDRPHKDQHEVGYGTRRFALALTARSLFRFSGLSG